jgi:hypothetical protein
LSEPGAKSTAGAASGEPAAGSASSSQPRSQARSQPSAEPEDIGGLLAGGVLPGSDQTEGTSSRALPGQARGRVALAGTAQAAGGPAATVMPGPVFLADASRVTVAWARRRALGLSSTCGISVALAVCAATWFSVGDRSDNFRAVAALWAGYVVYAVGRKAAQPQDRAEISAGSQPAPGSGLARLSTATGQTWQHQPGGVVSGAGQQAITTVATVPRADRRPIGPAAWLAALGGCLAESVVYAGLAFGAVAEHWSGVWELAVAVLGLLAVRNLMNACSTPPGFADEPDSPIRWICWAILTMPVGGRILLVGIVAPVWGARAALLALLDWAIISVGYGIAGRPAPGLSAEDRAQNQADQAGQRSMVLRLRDDGALARSLGVLVRGNLIPLPPAVLGLVAVSALALLGLHDLPGVLIIAPAVVMLLAAPGSANPHTGRFDWLVPVLLLGSQFLYLAGTGFAAGVPGPVIFVLGTALLLRYCDLAFPGRPVMLAKPRVAGADPAERGSALGWEGRLLLVGLAAAMGVATFAYLALTAYLGVLICAKVVTSCVAPQEEARP